MILGVVVIGVSIMVAIGVVALARVAYDADCACPYECEAHLAKGSAE